MQIHICDTRDLAVHFCCGGFIWPETVRACCGREFSFRQPAAESIDPGDETVCPDCLEQHRQLAPATCLNLFVIRD